MSHIKHRKAQMSHFEHLQWKHFPYLPLLLQHTGLYFQLLAIENMEAGQVAKIYLEWFSTWWAKGEGYFNFAWDKEVGTRQFVQFRDNDNASEWQRNGALVTRRNKKMFSPVCKNGV